MRRSEPWPWTLGVLLAYAAVTLVSTVFHEPWRDEGQAWLLVRDLPFVGLIHQMGYEGCPALWHLILLPFVRAGAPFAVEGYVHLLLAIGAVAIFLKNAPFPRWLKVLFVFGYYASYEYAVIARNYNLTMLLLFAIAALHRGRNDHPLAYGALIALLFNTNIHSAPACVGLGLLLLHEAVTQRSFAWKRWAALALVGVGGLLALYQLRSPADNMHGLSEFHFFAKAPAAVVKNAFLPWLPDTALSALPGALAMILVCLVLYRRSLPALFVLAISMAGLFAVTVFKHPGAPRHHGIALLFVVFALWIAYDADGKEARPLPFSRLRRMPIERIMIVLLGMCLAESAGVAFLAHVREVRGTFSGAKPMAEYLERSGLVDDLVFAHNSAQTSGVLPYLPGRKLWYCDVQEYGTFITWNERHARDCGIPVAEALDRATHSGLDHVGKLILLSAPLPASTAGRVRLVHQETDERFRSNEEQLYLYEILQ